ncbi:enoyl-CoA hydratase/isomerase family protein [Desulfoferula mesophila]|uniref:Enoyl-CoA hydratase n=1 Tax=Desulfoferula mesophila TaxID=3058419 RepID=A0AAU9EFP1_9BACT|nr:enoyl-CoA hydratase [Desulfoferula mesophilus]
MSDKLEARGYDRLLFEQRDAVLKVIINLPEKNNAINLEVRPELIDVFDKLQDDSSVKTVILTGAGNNFSFGGDLRSMEGIPGSMAAYDRMKYGQRLIKAMVDLPKPIIASVQGVAAGAAVSLVLASDLVIAAEQAKFVFAFIKVGLTPDWGQYFFLPLRVGMARSKQFMMEGGMISAKEAFDMGMINRIAPDAELDEQAWAWAQKLSKGATKAMSMVKAAMNCWPMNLSSYLDLEAGLQAIALTSGDHKEGREAFLEKRKPEFKGE